MRVFLFLCGKMDLMGSHIQHHCVYCLEGELGKGFSGDFDHISSSFCCVILVAKSLNRILDLEFMWIPWLANFVNLGRAKIAGCLAPSVGPSSWYFLWISFFFLNF